MEYIDDPTLPAGTEQIIIQEHIGKKYQTYKQYYDTDGNLVKTEEFSVETYDNLPAKIRRGTAAATPAPTSTTELPVTPIPNPSIVPAPEPSLSSSPESSGAPIPVPTPSVLPSEDTSD